MKERFCHNPQCRFNRVSDAESIERGYWINKSESSEGIVHRHEHATNARESVFLCDNCHSAVMLFCTELKSFKG